ncbi:MAG: HD-GYP domain-containing protein [Fusobacteriaceae bacterium]|nr:HD-GYP domain-containing protein [Fusobacteriaceae bacterium]MBN2837565.1 HD-GYP domain-containing protein [Fusobacteriaceae bacterium]
MKIKVLDLKEGMILKNPVFSDNKILMEKGQEITSKSIERLENYKISEVEILDGKEQELNKIQTEEKVIKEEFEKVYQETRVKAKEVFTKALNGNVDIKAVDTMIIDTIANLEKSKDIFLTLLSMRGEENYLYDHSIKSTIIALSIGKKLGYDKDQLRLLGKAALLHDVGMFSIDNEIINKKDKLNDKEMEIIRKHTLDGENLLRNEEEVVQLAAKFHHERIDGEGYPNRVKGEELPEIVRIISIADIYTALISSREYRDAKDPQEVIAYLMQMSSKQVDTNIVKKLLENMSLFSIGAQVKLSNGKIAKVVKATDNPFRPIVDTEDERIDLNNKKNSLIYIMRLVV